MSWMPIEIAKKIRDDLRAAAPLATVKLEVHPTEDATARVSVVLRDTRSGNTVYREATDSTTAATLLDDARRELKSRGRATRQRIVEERQQ